MTEAISARGRLWLLIGLVLAVIGMGVSAYSTSHHREAKATGQTNAACNISTTISCDDVALSEYSEVFGLPLGVYGFGYFAAMAVLAGIGLSRTKAAKEHQHGYIAMVLIGVVVSLVLAGISSFIIQKACITCIAVYVLCGLQAAALWVFWKDTPRGFDVKLAFSGGTTAAIAVALVAAGYSFLLPPVVPATAQSAGTPGQPLAPTVQEIPIARSAYAGLGEDYRKGPDTAPVTIVEFADFQCPACKSAGLTLAQLQREYGDRLQVVFRNYPLDSSCNSAVQSRLHEHACKAAVMARCAGQYGKFWEYHDIVFDKQSSVNEANLRAWGRQVGLSDEQIEACWTSQDLLAKVQDDVRLGNQLGVESTPTLFINGRKLVGGRSITDLRNQIDDLLNN